MMAARESMALRGELIEGEFMSRHTTWRVGGPADRFYRPADLDDLRRFLATLPPDEPLLWLGLGSNLLVRDGGLRGTVIALHGVLDGIERIGAQELRVGAGVPCPKVARHAASVGLTGAEFLAGIPGTMGGALAMNAGAFGGDTWSRVVEVQTIDRTGATHLRTPADYRIGYRRVEGPTGEWFIAARLRLEPGDGEAVRGRIRDLLAQRADTQPTGTASCGSVFANPQDDYAGRLIEAAGLKGHRIGGAEVSTRHANFILNTGAATAADIEALILHVQRCVQESFGVRLTPEVRIVGEPA